MSASDTPRSWWSFLNDIILSIFCNAHIVVAVMVVLVVVVVLVVAVAVAVAIGAAVAVVVVMYVRPLLQ